MKTAHIFSRLLPVFALFVGVTPLHAQWININGPDSVRALATGATLVGTDHGGGAILAGKNNTAYLSIPGATGLSSDTGGRYWIKGNAGQSNPLTSVAVFAGGFLAGTSGGGVFRSTNVAMSLGYPGGLAWNPINTGLSNVNVTALALISIGNGNVFAGTDGGGVFLSTNNGTNWTAINNGLTNAAIRSLAASFVASVVKVFAGTNGGGIFRSIDTGANWTAVNTGLTNMNVQALAFSGANVFAGTSGGGVFFSSNNGTSWTAASAGLTNLNVHALVYSTNLFAATDSGVFRSTNNGTNWTAVNTGLTNLRVNALAALAYSVPYLYAGVDNGIWRRPLSEMTTSVKRFSADLPGHYFSFDRNHSVSFHVPHQSFVSLKVLDLSGREVSVLFAEQIPAGTHTRQLNTTSLPNGLYFFRLQSGPFTSTKKVLMSR